jgi:O-antigen ligase
MCTSRLHSQVGDKVSHLIFRHFEPSSNLSRGVLLIVVPALLSNPVSYSVRSAFIAVPLVFAAYWSCLVLFIIAYRLSPFHPLAKYPGPVLAKSSKFWAAHHSAIGDQYRCYKDLHDRYGDVVRIGSGRHLPFETSPLIRFQAPTSSPSAMPP